jgi:hypothetical protein
VGAPQAGRVAAAGPLVMAAGLSSLEMAVPGTGLVAASPGGPALRWTAGCSGRVQHRHRAIPPLAPVHLSATAGIVPAGAIRHLDHQQQRTIQPLQRPGNHEPPRQRMRRRGIPHLTWQHRPKMLQSVAFSSGTGTGTGHVLVASASPRSRLGTRSATSPPPIWSKTLPGTGRQERRQNDRGRAARRRDHRRARLRARRRHRRPVAVPVRRRLERRSPGIGSHKSFEKAHLFA